MVEVVVEVVVPVVEEEEMGFFLDGVEQRLDEGRGLC